MSTGCTLFNDTIVNEGGWVDGQVAGVFCGTAVGNKQTLLKTGEY
jgi:hypothetical protein